MNSVVGIIINERNHNDNDKIISILCENGVFLTLLANNVRKYTSKNRAATQILTLCEIEYKPNLNRFSIIRNTKVINSFSSLKLNYSLLVYGMYYCEVINKLSYYNVFDNNIFILVHDALSNINESNCNILKILFDLKLFKELGIAPNLKSCTSCTSTNIQTINHISGGYICESCVDSSMTMYSLKSLAMLKYLENLPFDYQQNIVISNNVLAEINEFIRLYYEYHLNLKISTFDYLKIT